jgi:hypothetical protein
MDEVKDPIESFKVCNYCHSPAPITVVIILSVGLPIIPAILECKEALIG